MAEPALARGDLCALRSEIERLESADVSNLGRMARGQTWDRAAAAAVHERVETGAETFDEVLGGGLARAALHEIRTEATADNGAASGFALALSRLVLGRGPGLILWIADPMGARESGRLYAPGLMAHGLPSASLLHAAPRKLKDALMVAEAALTVSSFAAVVFEVYGNPARFGLTESRRISLRAKAHKKPVFVLRERGGEEASSAESRLLVRPAPSSPVRMPGGQTYEAGLGRPVFHVTLEKSRNPLSPDFYLEWNADDCLFRAIEPGRIAVRPAERPADPGALVSLSGDRSARPDPMGQVMAFSRAS